MAKTKLNQGYYKEALDRCLCMSKMIKEVILTHPVVEQNEQASHLVQGACSEIDAVAQLILAKAKDNDGTMDDRTYWFFIVLNELLATPIVLKDHKAKAYAKEATDALWKLYQHLGDKATSNDNQPKPKHKPARKGVRK